MDFATPKFNQLILYMLVAFGLIAAAYAYVYTELNTRWNLDSIASATEFCAEPGTTLQAVKLVEYKPQKGDATLYCLYEQKAMDKDVHLSKVEENWVVQRERYLNEDGRFVWPIY